MSTGPTPIEFLIFLCGKKSKIKSVVTLSSNNFTQSVRHNPIFLQHSSKHDALPLSELWFRTIGQYLAVGMSSCRIIVYYRKG